MKKTVALLYLALVSFSMLAGNFEKFKFTNYVNDYGNLLSKQEQDELNHRLKIYQDSTSNQIAILTLTSYDNVKNGPLFDFSMSVFEDWKIGQKAKDNGVLLVVVKNLASKNAPGLRIVTGYGLEGPLPDAICNRIVESIRPLVNEGNYYKGIDLAVTTMIFNIKEEFTADNKKSDDMNNLLILIVVIVIIIIIIAFVVGISGGSSGGGYYYGSSSDSSYSSGDSDGGGFDGGGGGSSGGGGAGD